MKLSLIILRMMGLAILICALSPLADVRATTAQFGPLLAVHVDPIMAEPGARVGVTVIASGSGSRVHISVNVPRELTIGDDLRCVHKTSYCNGISSTGAGLVTASAPGNVSGPTGYSSSTQVYVTFSVLVPQSAVPGTRYEINATMDGLFNVLQPEQGNGAQAFAVLTVEGVAGQQSGSSSTPTNRVSEGSQEAPGAQSFFVGQTNVRWTGNWQLKDMGDSTGDGVLLSQIDNGVITVVTYREVHDYTINSSSAMLSKVIGPLFEVDRLEDLPVEAGSGELDDGTVWSALNYELSGSHVTHLITVSEAMPGRFIISTLLSATATFTDSLGIAQGEILLNGKPAFLKGIEAELLVN